MIARVLRSPGATAYATALALVTLATLGPVVTHIHNRDTLAQADRMFELSSVHGSPPSVGARLAAQEERALALTSMYGQRTAEFLSEMPEVQVEAGLALLWLTPLWAFLLLAVVRRKMPALQAATRQSVYAWAAAVCLANVIVCAAAMTSLNAPWESATRTALRMTAAQGALGASYLCAAGMLGSFVGGGFLPWLALCTLSFWMLGSVSFVATQLTPGLAPYLLTGVTRDLLDPSVAVTVRGLAVAAAWALCFAWTGNSLVRARSARTQPVMHQISSKIRGAAL